MSIHYKTKSEMAYERLKSDIISGKFDLNSPLVAGKLAKEYGLSSMPVREAMKRLEQDGLVESVPNCGCRVALFNYMTHLENMLIRTILELQMIGPISLTINNEQLTELHAKIQQLEKVLQQEDYPAFAEVQQDFYEMLFSCSPYEEIEVLWHTYFEKTKIYRFFMLSIPARTNIVATEFEQLLQNIEEHSPAECKSLLDSIQKENFNIFVDFLKKDVTSSTMSLPKRFFLSEHEELTAQKTQEILRNLDQISAIRNKMI